MKRSKLKSKIINKVSIIVLLTIMLVLSLATIYTINQLRVNNSFVNYLNSINIGTQRLVKLELGNHEDAELEQKIIDLITALNSKEYELDIDSFSDAELNDSIDTIFKEWTSLLNEIKTSRETDEISEDLISSSESFFNEINTSTMSIQAKSENLTSRLLHTEFLLVLVIITLIYSLSYQILDSLHLETRNKELSAIAYTDAHTGLPNKTMCNQILSNTDPIFISTTAFMFDLNYLKKTNDTLGHVAGDKMISDFANILRKCFSEKYFVGRFGGDEFIAIVEHSNPSNIKSIIDKITSEVKLHNDTNDIQISFAFGFANSKDNHDFTIEDLLDKADSNMYINKQKMHENMDK